MLIREIEKSDEERESSYEANFQRAKDENLCPTCENAKHKNIFFDDPNEIVFEDELFLVRFEHNPRREGHSLIIVKPHYEDISEMPIELAHKFLAISKALVDSLKFVLKPVKVYLVTMCDGGRNHLHFQYIPRYEGEKHGKYVFISERKIFNYEKEKVDLIKQKFLDQLRFYRY